MEMARTGIAIFVVLACALFLRLYNLNQYDLWFDELGTDMFSSANLTKMAELSKEPVSSLMIDRMKNDPHSPLYYVLVYAYSIFFADVKSLRVISVVFSMLSLAVFYKLSRLIFDRQTSFYALLLMAFNPFHLWYAQEARVYAMSCFFSLLTIYVYWKALKTDQKIYWFYFPVISILAVYSSYYFFFLFLALGIMLFCKIHRHAAQKWFLSLLIVLISLMLLRSLLANHLHFVKNDFWLPAPTIYMMLFSWNIFALGYSATGIQYWLGFVLFSSLFVYGVFSCYRTKRVDALLFLPILFFPILSIYLLSKFFMPVYMHRQLIIFSPIYYLFIAKGIASISKTNVRILAVVCSALLVTLSLLNYHRGFMFYHPGQLKLFTGALPKKNYNDLLTYLSKEFKEGDLIGVADLQSYLIVFSHILKQPGLPHRIPLQRFRFFSYPKDLLSFEKRFLHIVRLIEVISEEDREKLHSFQPFYNGTLELEELGIDKNKFSRIWLMSASWYKPGPLEQNSYNVHYYMTTNFERVLLEEKDGINLELFVKEGF